MASEDAASKPKGMCIATRCTSVDHFVEMFHRFVDEDSFFVSTNNTRPPGLETSFSVQLTDGTPVLRGLCVVLQAWTTPASPFKTPGVRLGIKRLTASSMPVFERLLVTRSKPPTTTPPFRKAEGTPQLKAQILDRKSTEADDAKTTVGGKSITSREETTTISGKAYVAPGEERTPGSSYVLPANPLMNLTDESLNGYVDCTLYEETANYFPASDDGSSEDALVPPPKAAAAAAASEPEPLFSPRPVSRLSTTPVEIVAEDILVEPPARPSRPSVPPKPPARARVTTPPQVAVIPPKAIPMPGPEPESLDRFEEPSVMIERSPDLMFDDSGGNTLDSAPGLVLEPKGMSQVGRLPVPPAATPPAAVPVVYPVPDAALGRDSAQSIGFASRDSAPAGEIAAPIRRPAAPPLASSRKRYALVAGAGVLAVATIFSIRALGASDDDTTTSAAPASAPALVTPSDDEAAQSEAQVQAPATPPQAAEAQPEAEAAAEPEAEIENPDPDGDGGVLTAGEGPCKVDVASTPAGSMVYLDGSVVAPSPITLATTCARHKIDIKHPRYKLLTKMVTPTETEPGKVEVTLQRPTHSVTFTSSPPGATVFIDGRRAGTTPTTVNMLGFSNLKIEIKKTGFVPLSTRFYSKVANDKFSTKLRKW